MLDSDRLGRINDARVELALHPQLERGDMPVVVGIIVHQTDLSAAASTLASYKLSPNGAHLLIDKDGTIYQTASLKRRVNHVGKLRARCLAEHSCAPAELPEVKARPLPRNRDETTEECARFRLATAEVRRYFAQAGRVDHRASNHDLPMSRCHTTGSVVFSNGIKGRWTIDRARRGMLVLLTGERRYLYCMGCMSVRFDDLDEEDRENGRTLIQAFEQNGE